MKPEFFLPSLGIVCPLGNDKDEVLSNLLRGYTGGVVYRDGFIPNQPISLGSVFTELPQIPASLDIYNNRCNRLLLAAYLQIEKEVQQAVNKYGKDRIAVIIGTGTSSIDEVQTAIENSAANNSRLVLDHNSLEIASPSKFMQDYIGLANLNYTVSTACTSSAKAFISAKNLINMGVCDAVLVGGSDTLCKLTVNGFYALESLSLEACNPFSKNRNGTTLGEGAAIFLVTKDTADIALLGTGESSDAYHKTSPDPEGKGALAAIEMALKDAGLSPKDVDYINLHGTGTVLNDDMESKVVHTIFPDTYCSSTKPMTGHTLGSAGIIELALCWLLLSKKNAGKTFPIHIWDKINDNSLPKLNFVEENKQISLQNLSICMSNSFAFGGSNVSLIIGKTKNV